VVITSNLQDEKSVLAKMKLGCVPPNLPTVEMSLYKQFAAKGLIEGILKSSEITDNYKENTFDPFLTFARNMNGLSGSAPVVNLEAISSILVGISYEVEDSFKSTTRSRSAVLITINESDREKFEWLRDVARKLWTLETFSKGQRYFDLYVDESDYKTFDQILQYNRWIYGNIGETRVTFAAYYCGDPKEDEDNNPIVVLK
jgi:hypothetical protein